MKISKITKKTKTWHTGNSVEVKTPSGSKTINKIWFNDFVKPLELVFKKVGQTYKIKCTNEHKFLSLHHGWVEAQDLVSGYLFQDGWIFNSSIQLNEFYPTFDIEVPDEHCYILECGIVSHNSSILFDTTPSNEPAASNIFTHRTRVGSNIIKNKYLNELLIIKSKEFDNSEEWVNEQWKIIIADDGSVQDLDCLNDLEKKVYLTAYEIDQRFVIDQARIRQIYICQSQSVNVFFNAGVNKKTVNDVHRRAFSRNPELPGTPMKSLYYCRTAKEAKIEKVSGSIVRNKLTDYETQATTVAETECLSCQG